MFVSTLEFQRPIKQRWGPRVLTSPFILSVFVGLGVCWGGELGGAARDHKPRLPVLSQFTASSAISTALAFFTSLLDATSQPLWPGRVLAWPPPLVPPGELLEPLSPAQTSPVKPLDHRMGVRGQAGSSLALWPS